MAHQSACCMNMVNLARFCSGNVSFNSTMNPHIAQQVPVSILIQHVESFDTAFTLMYVLMRSRDINQHRFWDDKNIMPAVEICQSKFRSAGK